MKLKPNPIAAAVLASLPQPDAEEPTTTIHTVDERVVVRFPSPIVWLTLTADEADSFAALLTQHAREAREGADSPAPPTTESPTMTDFTVDLPTYRCHKVVSAAKIVAIDHGERLDLAPHGVVEVGATWIKEKHAEVGGYFVRYDDGYASYSPAKAFEEGYALAPVLTEADAAADLAGLPRPSPGF